MPSPLPTSRGADPRWYAKSTTATLATLGAAAGGLTASAAMARLAQYGRNELPTAPSDSLARIFVRQFQSPLIYVLFAAAVAVLAMGDAVDAAIIGAVLLFNAGVGTLQEGRAQNTLAALRHFVATTATVLRDGREDIVSDAEVVPGDTIVLQEGERVPADARVLVASNLAVDEAPLTGESTPVHKAEITLRGDASLAEQRNMVFKGTYVLTGSGRALVVATGTNTAVGRIAQKLVGIDSDVPLKAKVQRLSRAIVMTVGSISVLLFVGGLAAGRPVADMFATVVSLAVSIIPEGLPIVLTLVLATGVWRMSKRNALVKRLQAVEALGQAQVIAVDKTGTIIKNELVVQKVYVAGEMFDISGSGYDPAGEVRAGGSAVDPASHPELLLAGRVAALCAGARVVYDEATRQWRVAGDPTEAALLVLSRKVGFHRDDLVHEFPLLAEIPFDYRLKYRAALHQGEAKVNLLAAVGAPEVILAACSSVQGASGVTPLDSEQRRQLDEVFTKFSRAGLRVIAGAVAKRDKHSLAPGDLADLTFVGFYAMKDGLRPEVRSAVTRAQGAGIRVVMITGDNRITARAVAREAGIYRAGDTVLTGTEVDHLDDAALAQRVTDVAVFARVTPEHKLRIINAYRSRGEVVAMTGDGVNDAPSLVAADLGVAMGKIGTEVAKEAADIVLLDDNFSSIVAAVEEGRSIIRTIKKVITYLFSTSLGELLTIAVALVLGMPLPLLAAQIIWLNFVTDTFLDVSLGMEPREPGLLDGRAPAASRYLVDGAMVRRMVLMALPMAAGTLLMFYHYLGSDIVKAGTVALTTLTVFQWFNAWNCRSANRSVFRQNPFTNPYLLGATAVTVSLHLLAIYAPPLQGILRTVPLSLNDWLIIIPVAASVFVVEEVRKAAIRLHRRSARLAAV
jgi:Ca2+-transporting ATPase